MEIVTNFSGESHVPGDQLDLQKTARETKLGAKKLGKVFWGLGFMYQIIYDNMWYSMAYG